MTRERQVLSTDFCFLRGHCHFPLCRRPGSEGHASLPRDRIPLNFRKVSSLGSSLTCYCQRHLRLPRSPRPDALVSSARSWVGGRTGGTAARPSPQRRRRFPVFPAFGQTPKTPKANRPQRAHLLRRGPRRPYLAGRSRATAPGPPLSRCHSPGGRPARPGPRRRPWPWRGRSCGGRRGPVSGVAPSTRHPRAALPVTPAGASLLSPPSRAPLPSRSTGGAVHEAASKWPRSLFGGHEG